MDNFQPAKQLMPTPMNPIKGDYGQPRTPQPSMPNIGNLPGYSMPKQQPVQQPTQPWNPQPMPTPKNPYKGGYTQPGMPSGGSPLAKIQEHMRRMQQQPAQPSMAEPGANRLDIGLRPYWRNENLTTNSPQNLSLQYQNPYSQQQGSFRSFGGQGYYGQMLNRLRGRSY
jgi:hypothetical protein